MWALVLVLFCALRYVAANTHHGLILPIGPGVTRCIGEMFYVGGASLGTRAIPRPTAQEGGQASVEVVVIAPTGENIIRRIVQYGEAMTRIHFGADGGLYRVCLRNMLSGKTGTAEMVELTFSQGSTRERAAPPDAISAANAAEAAEKDKEKENQQPVEGLFGRAEEAARAINQEMRYMIAREAELLIASEELNHRVSWFSTFSIFVVVGVSMWQMTYLKGFFKAKKLL